MASYTQPIKTAFLVFPVLALIITIPYLIYQYRKFGGIPFLRGLIVYSFVFYLMCAWFMTILPLPPKEVVEKMTFYPIQAMPFQFVKDFFRETVLVIGDSSTYLPALKQGVVFQPLFNVLLLFPLGIYLRYYFEFSFGKTVLASFLLSLFFEVTQLTGIYGIYPRAFRLFDVDDLMLNTLGGIIGYVVAPLFVFFLPKRKQIDEKAYQVGTNVSLVRRGVALIIDTVIIAIITLILSTIFNSTLGKFSVNISNFILQLLYFIGITTVTSGQTIGKKIVKIKVVQEKDDKIQKPEFLAILKRYAFLYIGLPVSLFIITTILNFSDYFKDNSLVYPIFIFGGLVLLLAWFVVVVVFCVYVIICIIRKKHVLFYERSSKTHLESTLTSANNLVISDDSVQPTNN